MTLYVFNGRTVDTVDRELTVFGHTQPLEARAFDVVEFLLEHRHRLVSREDLIESVWDGAHLAESTVPNAIWAARRALRGAERNAFIVTVRGRGYRFNPLVSVWSQ